MKNKFKKVFFLLVAIVLAVCGIGNIIPQEFAVADETITTEYSKKVYLASNSTNIANRVTRAKNFKPSSKEKLDAFEKLSIRVITICILFIIMYHK